jgi:hypothetical protein
VFIIAAVANTSPIPPGADGGVKGYNIGRWLHGIHWRGASASESGLARKSKRKKRRGELKRASVVAVVVNVTPAKTLISQGLFQDPRPIRGATNLPTNPRKTNPKNAELCAPGIDTA